LWLLHGNLGSKADWQEIAELLQQRGIATRSVDLWELLCCDVCSLEQAAARLNAVVAAQSPQGAVLAGYSLGGRIALHMLLERPQLYRAAVVLGAHCGLAADSLRQERLQADMQWAASALQLEWGEFLQLWDMQNVFEAGEVGDKRRFAQWQQRRERLFKRRLPISRAFVHWSLGRQQDLRGELASLEMPLAWVCGAQDHKFAAIAREICATRSNFYWHKLEGAGHRLLLQKPEQVAALLADFYHRNLPVLKKVSPDSTYCQDHVLPYEN